MIFVFLSWFALVYHNYYALSMRISIIILFDSTTIDPYRKGLFNLDKT